ncbi:hypothetical protein [Vibrio crassostreae]|uniref:hypothetical protein n=1 Tax=Vibrio crassostreae TaxID=246167 RepID=UPI000F4E5F8F|nr:hypothetical protein [Vibrio crassostreae]RPF57296.1 hypothetical protein EDB61_105198 [Vibrio crassostreae]
MKHLGLLAILSVTISGCANTELSESLQTVKVTVNKEYSDVVINNALRATCFDIKDIYPAFGCSASKEDTSTQFSVYDLVSDFDSNDNDFFYTRKIVEIEKKFGKKKKVIDETPYLGGDLAEGLQVMLPKYDSLLKSNLEKQQKRYDAGMNLQHSGLVDEFISVNSKLIPIEYFDEKSLRNGLDKFYSDNRKFNYIYSKENFVGEYGTSNELRNHDFFVDMIYSELKKQLISSLELPVKVEYCNESDKNLRLCTVSSTPFRKGNKFSDSNITLAAFYRYSSPFGYVVRVTNNTNNYITLKNSDVLYKNKYYSVEVNGTSLPPKSEKVFEINTPNRFHPYVKAESRTKVVDYGVVARYEYDGQSKIINKTLKYSPFSPLYK